MWHLSTTHCRQYSQVSAQFVFVRFSKANGFCIIIIFFYFFWWFSKHAENYWLHICMNCYFARRIGRQIMEKGASQPWQEILQEVTGEGRLDGTALREFFRPLEEWLRQENLRNNEIVGWNYDGDYCKHRSVQFFTDYIIIIYFRHQDESEQLYGSFNFFLRVHYFTALIRPIYKCTAVSTMRLQLHCPMHRLQSH